MPTPLPRIGQSLVLNDRTTPPFYKWFESVNRALTDGGLSSDEAAAAIAAIATKLGSPDGTVANIPESSYDVPPIFAGMGISIAGAGTVAAPWIVSLNATTDQVPEGATNLYFTNVRADARVALFAAAPIIGPLTNAVDDTAAAAASVPIGGLYRNGSIVQIRVT